MEREPIKNSTRSEMISLRVEQFLTTAGYKHSVLTEQKTRDSVECYFFLTNVTRTGSFKELAGTAISIVLNPLAFTFSFRVPM